MKNGLKIYLNEVFKKNINMPFDPNSAKKADKKSKRGPVKKEGPSIKEKMEMGCEKVLDDLLVNQEKLTKTERVKVFVTLSGYIFPKNKPVKEDYELEKPIRSPTIIKFVSPSKPTK
jgi:hypothetical protein